MPDSTPTFASITQQVAWQRGAPSIFSSEGGVPHAQSRAGLGCRMHSESHRSESKSSLFGLSNDAIYFVQERAKGILNAHLAFTDLLPPSCGSRWSCVPCGTWSVLLPHLSSMGRSPERMRCASVENTHCSLTNMQGESPTSESQNSSLLTVLNSHDVCVLNHPGFRGDQLV